jgi:hypothetical protein
VQLRHECVWSVLRSTNFRCLFGNRLVLFVRVIVATA